MGHYQLVAPNPPSARLCSDLGEGKGEHMGFAPCGPRLLLMGEGESELWRGTGQTARARERVVGWEVGTVGKFYNERAKELENS